MPRTAVPTSGRAPAPDRIRRNACRFSGSFFRAFSFDDDFGFAVDRRMGRNRLGEPYVTADHRVVTDHRVAAEDRAAGVDDHVVLDGRMAPDARKLFVDKRGAQRDALVNFDVPPDNGRFADDDPGAVVDVEVRPDGGSRVDVDSGLAVRVFRNHARQYWYFQFVQHVRQAVHHHGVESRIAQDHLFGAVGRRVAVFVKVGVLHQPGVYQRDFAEKPFGEMFAATVHVGAQRADDLQEIVLEILPFQIHFLQRDVPFVPYREQQVGFREVLRLDRENG